MGGTERSGRRLSAGRLQGWKGRLVRLFKGLRFQRSAWLDALLHKEGRRGHRMAGARVKDRGVMKRRQKAQPDLVSQVVMDLRSAGASFEGVCGERRRLECGEDERFSDSELSEATTLPSSDATDQLARESTQVCSGQGKEDFSMWDIAAARALDPLVSEGGGGSSPHHTDKEDSSPSPSRGRRPGNVLAVDCEMVGAGPKKNRSLLARCAIVDEFGHVLMDEYVQPTERVTDYRTRWSGIRPKDLVGAPPFQDVRQRAASIIRGKLLVGHAIENDLKVLKLPHPPALVRDTSQYPGLRMELARKSKEYDASKPPSLKALTKGLLKQRIQEGEHCPVEDARATMELYLRHRAEWELSLL